jgi:hypothetical protein
VPKSKSKLATGKFDLDFSEMEAMNQVNFNIFESQIYQSRKTASKIAEISVFGKEVRKALAAIAMTTSVSKNAAVLC